ncbi:hypothetical protein PV327_002616 [Microctonus hyperodae]|uniref:Uncharacterized protein n=1 Tax=Microctonus hyperodae TaxID=165561 RepID=A0AA39KPK0_MICHY|nr:hypothetical protein PV327_002616 [Microctonus hyperodae]
MIFNLIVVITIASITVSNSIPISMENSDSSNLYNDNVNTLTRSKRFIRLGDLFNDHVNYLQNVATNNPVDHLDHDAMNLIDVRNDQPKEIIERTNENIENTIDSVDEIFKAKIKTARRLISLLFNETPNLSQFATRFINKFSPNHQDSTDCNQQ